mmetsp:Transcript_235/g.529  ORF Transcript_235/g.529 Transcript_235/m.529 type:complete len:185 (+) Transcript_235:81-635(+)
MATNPPTGQEEVPWRSEVARLELQLGELRDAVARDSLSRSAVGPMRPGVEACPAVKAPSQELAEMYRELEALELALAKERQRVRALEEEKAVREASHARDIAELEEMLNQATAEQERLVAENKRLQAEISEIRKSKECAPSEDWASTTSRSVWEPEIERSGEFDLDRLSRLRLGDQINDPSRMH